MSATMAILEVEQGEELRVGDEDDVAAVAAVAARGTTVGHVGLATERRATVPAVPGLDVDLGFVDELHDGASGAREDARTPTGLIAEEARPAAAF
jgi:hypothetical protein